MAENFYTLLTTIGKSQFANSTALGTKINFKTLKVGDGNGAYYNPTEDQTDLKNTKWTGSINSISIDSNNPNWIVLETMVPSDVGGFTIREYGAFDDNGNMLAISKCAETYKPIIADGSTKELLIKMVLAVSNTENVTLKIDPTIIFAKKADVDQLRTDINSQLAECDYVLIPKSGSTANVILLNITSFTSYKKYSFRATSTSTGNVTINGKPLKKVDGITLIGSGGIKANKVYDFYYDSATDSVFILAKAEGDATVDNVLATKGFSNGDDVGLIGTMPNNGAINYNIPINGSFTIPLGYTIGGKITQSIPTKASATINPSTTQQVISGNQYLTGDQFIAPVTGNTTINDVVSGKVFSSGNGINLVGQATIESLGGKQYKEGSFTHIQGSGNVINLSFSPRIIYITWTRASNQIVNLVSTPDTNNIYYTGGSSTPSGFTKNSNGFSIDSGIENSSFSWYCWN
jgi:phage-related tail fiber protein